MMSTHTLLLVDDSITTEQQVRSACAGESIQVVVAVNGHRALDRIEADRPDVVLASATALGVTGYGLAHYVSQRPYLRNVAVLLLTDSVDEKRIRESGARGFIRYPVDPSVVLARVKEALRPLEPQIAQADVFGQLGAAFDAIDESMTSKVFGQANPQELAITPDALARIVNEAVAHAIAAYEHERGLAPEPPRDSTAESASRAGARRRAPRAPKRPATVPLSPERAELLRLQGDMGLGEIEFEEAPPRPTESVVYAELSVQMGVGDFTFDDAPAPAAKRVVAAEPAIAAAPPPPPLPPPPPALTPTPARAPAPVPPPAPQEVVVLPTTLPPDLDEQVVATEPLSSAAVDAGKEAVHARAADSPGDFEFDASDLPLAAETTVDPISREAPVAEALDTFAASTFTPQERDGRPEEPVASVTRVLEPLRSAVLLLGTAVADRATRLRSALAERAQRRAEALAEREQRRAEARAAAIAAAAAAAPAVPEPPPPEPWRAPEPAPAPKAPSEPLTPEEAAKSIFFTFDPIPPVPPRIPREPRKD